MTEAVLFVGGSADGQKWVKDNTRDYIDIPVMTQSGAVWTDSPKHPNFTMERYRRQILHNGIKEYPIYLIETEPVHNLIPLLIDGYRRKE